MKWSDISLFSTIVRKGNLSVAARDCGITQSAASQSVTELEREFGVALLDRSHRPVSATAAGKHLLQFCERVSEERGRLDTALATLREASERTVRLVTIYSVGLSEVNRLREQFALRMPGVELTSEPLRPEKVYDAVLEGRADLGIVSYPKATRQLAVIPWREEEMVVATAPTHRFATLPSLHPSHLAGEAFVAFEDDLPVQQHVDRFLKQQKVTIRKVLHVDNIDSMREAVAQNQGISIMPKPVAKPWAELGRLAAVPLLPKTLRRPLGIVHHRRRKLSAAAAEFLALLKESAPARLH